MDGNSCTGEMWEICGNGILNMVVLLYVYVEQAKGSRGCELSFSGNGWMAF